MQSEGVFLSTQTSVYLVLNVQAHLGDTEGSVPEHHNKTTIIIK